MTRVAAVTSLVEMVKVPLATPAGMVIEAGTVATLTLLLASVTTAPPAGATELRVTVAVLVPPPVTVVGLSRSEARDGFTARVKRASAKSLFPVKLAPPAATSFPSSCTAMEDTASLAAAKMLVTLPPVPKVVSSMPSLL